ncbi:hypothetical protein TNIN_286801, partial [Trichonephila inaurata madagascariensis]
MLNSSLTSIENHRNNFANIKEEAIGLAKKWGITPEFEKKRHRKVRQFFDDFNADEKLQDRERLFEVDVFKANVDVLTTQLKNRLEITMRPKKHPYRNSRSKSQRLRKAKEIIKDLLSKTQNAETQLLGVPGSSSREMKLLK